MCRISMTSFPYMQYMAESAGNAYGYGFHSFLLDTLVIF